MGQQLNEKSKQLLTRASDRISFLYVEKARIEQSEYGVQIRQGNKTSEVPITTISCLMLGPGTTVTHKAISNIAQAGCSVCWMGMEQAVFYAFGEPATNKSNNILKQCHYHESKVLHSEIIHKMYNYRYPNDKIKSMSLEELKGYEGMKVKECYQKNADAFGVDWTGRLHCVGFENSTIPNQYITAINHIFYAITMAIICIMGYSPSIGFIHTGHINSFVFDIFDLYKEELTIPLAFRLTKQVGYFDRHIMLREYRKELIDKKIIHKMVAFLEDMFDNNVTMIDTELNIWNSYNDNI